MNRPFISGLTLVELLVALALISILLGFGVPSAQAILAKYRLTAHINDIGRLLHISKTHSIVNYEITTLCPTLNMQKCDRDWRLPIMLFVDQNNNGLRDNTEALISSVSTRAHLHSVKGPKNPIKFYDSGITASPVSITICTHNTDYQYINRALVVSLQGRIRLSSDLNNDGFHQRSNGNRLSCI
ncbi:MAG: GspH/FimT family pseudopilin [Glaciecola sp.]